MQYINAGSLVVGSLIFSFMDYSNSLKSSILKQK